MAPILGARALLDIAVPTGVDASEVLRFQLEDGADARDVISMAAMTIGDANQMISDRYGGLWYITERLYARYRQGEASRSMTPEKSEFATPPAVRTDKIGHMLPRTDYEDALAWSREYLERANREDLSDDADLIAERFINRVDYEVVWRQLRTDEVVIGTAGYNVPWAIGTGVNVNYIPPQWRGNIFSSSHTHFVRVNGALNATTALSTLEAMAKHLSHHGHLGRKVAIVAEDDLAYYTGMDATKFAAFLPREFQTVGGASSLTYVDGELQGIPGEVFGYVRTDYGVVALVYHERYPAGYIHMTKSYGVNDRRNGLAMRVMGAGFGLQINPQVDRSLVPQLDTIAFKTTQGVGINDRLNGVSAQVAAGGATYTNPTIT